MIDSRSSEITQKLFIASNWLLTQHSVCTQNVVLGEGVILKGSSNNSPRGNY